MCHEYIYFVIIFSSKFPQFYGINSRSYRDSFKDNHDSFYYYFKIQPQPTHLTLAQNQLYRLDIMYSHQIIAIRNLFVNILRIKSLLMYEDNDEIDIHTDIKCTFLSDQFIFHLVTLSHRLFTYIFRSSRRDFHVRREIN